MTIKTYNNNYMSYNNLMTLFNYRNSRNVCPKRRKEKHPIPKEEERVTSLLKKLKDRSKITDILFDN